MSYSVFKFRCRSLHYVKDSIPGEIQWLFSLVSILCARNPKRAVSVDFIINDEGMYFLKQVNTAAQLPGTAELETFVRAIVNINCLFEF